MANTGPLKAIKSTPLLIVSFALIAQTVALHAISRPEKVLPAAPLSGFPTAFADWRMQQEGYVDDETRTILQADDLLSRVYLRPSDGISTSLFVASFLSQRNGKAPHSPKNCLPGAGWVRQTNEIINVEVPGTGPIEVNHYVIANRESRSDVMYWYQSHHRVVASEYRAKIYVVADAIRYNRTDTALVRVITPIINGRDDLAKQTNVEFIQNVFQLVRNHMPN